MNYIGSKLSLLNFLDESITSISGSKKRVFCDLFAGTGAVGRHFKKKGYKIISNDIQFYSYVLNRHYIGNHKPLNFSKLQKIIPEIKETPEDQQALLVCDYLSNMEGSEGFIYRNYCPTGTLGSEFSRQYFSDYNGKLCDSARREINSWRQEGLIADDEFFFLLTSLLEAIDKCANTASVYGAFLKKIKKSAMSKMRIRPAEIFINDEEHVVHNQDINTLIENIQGDILYLDPPYNHRQYATNYHVLETIAKYDNPELYGKTGLRDYQQQKSLYCSRTKVKHVFADLIDKSNFKYIFLSYNNEGLLSLSDIEEIFSNRGEYGCFTQNYNRFKADRDKNRQYIANNTIEYLHYVKIRN
jgi:adenine-specific DNA-methyltransferase